MVQFAGVLLVLCASLEPPPDGDLLVSAVPTRTFLELDEGTEPAMERALHKSFSPELQLRLRDLLDALRGLPTRFELRHLRAWQTYQFSSPLDRRALPPK
jgi:hypothetical protein